MRRRLTLALRVTPVLILLSGLPARGELYRWTDANGHLHVTAHLDEVPPGQRPHAAAAAVEPSRLQSFRSPTPSRVTRANAAPSGAADAAGAVHHIRVERAGTGMIVQVRLNDRVTAPFLIDTGASDVLLPSKVAEELGLRAGPETRTIRYATANGVVDQPVLMLDAVEVGGARVEGVPASISPSLGVGLLGLSFFNHFTYRVDAAAGIVTLSPNGLVAAGLIRGGRSEAQWRVEFENVRGRISETVVEAERTPSSHGRERLRLEDERARLERQLAQLDLEADEAHVPVSWRD